ncbi:MAG TPA: cupin domain-containing protein [Burkholderiaceae bacterium]|nr:cupin domain-containing protein [Burkholderiaceae bacterium]
MNRTSSTTPRIPVEPLRHLGTMPVATFLRDYWQRRPLLVRKAFAAGEVAMDPDALLSLAARDDGESRLVTAFDGDWHLAHGPLPRRAVPSRRRSRWTVLVQGVDGIDRRAQALLQRFRFLPDARLDDVMMSFATDGGGVGPHVDSYDVFLIQSYGRRRWSIDRRRRAAQVPLLPGLPLKILARFEPTDSWILEPGDMLYLPPDIAHDGVALGESITSSVGFRAPAWQELVEPWHALMADTTRVAGRYVDPGTRPTREPARLPPALVAAAFAQLSRRRPTSADATRMLLEILSEPKAHIVFDRPTRGISASAFASALERRGVVADPRTRMLYAGSRFAINGEATIATPALAPPLRELANRRRLPRGDGSAGRATTTTLSETLRIWYLAGWIHLG